MIDDNYNILKLLKNNDGKISIKRLARIISTDLQKDILSDTDKVLLNLVFTEKPEQEDVDKCLEKYDIEVTGGHKALLLSYFMKMHPDLKYSDYVAPRLRGLLQFYRFQNMKLISHYTKICRELEKANINFLILKGGCMKYLRPDYPRVMNDIDILVDEKDWKKSGQIAEKMGYEIYWDIHSLDIHPKGTKEGIMDIHKYIIMETEKEKVIIKDIYKRSIKQKVFGIETFVPSNEDLFFIILVNMVRNLRHKTSYGGILYNLFDNCNKKILSA